MAEHESEARPQQSPASRHDAALGTYAHRPAEGDEAFSQMARRLNQRSAVVAQRAAAESLNGARSRTMPQPRNLTGLPDGLKAGMEALSGFSMSDVRVHRNSAKPAQLKAHAYAQGSDIHLAPGQERHLPHEAWHVVQQKQGRVRPTLHDRGIGINEDPALEREADVNGARALHAAGAGADGVQLVRISEPVVQGAGMSKMAGPPDVDWSNIYDFAILMDDIIKAYGANDGAALAAVDNRISSLRADDEDVSAEEALKLKQLVGRARQLFAHKAKVRGLEQPASSSASPANEEKGQSPVTPKGQVPANAAAYKAEARKVIAGFSKRARPSLADLANDLYLAAGRILMPVLYKVDALPDLIPVPIQTGTADGLFNKGDWMMTLSASANPADFSAESAMELAATIVHEFRHVEQAFTELLMNRPPKGRRQVKTEAIIASVTRNTEKGRKILDSFQGVDSNVKSVVVADKDYHKKAKYREKEKDYNAVAAYVAAEAQVADLYENPEKMKLFKAMGGSLINDSPAVSAVEGFFDYEEGYYNNPREMDAFATEAIFRQL
jgi:hypothetical protein